MAGFLNIPGAPGNLAGISAARQQIAQSPGRGLVYFDPTPPTKGPAGYKPPGTYDKNQFYNLSPGFQFPSPNLPATTPGLSNAPTSNKPALIGQAQGPNTPLPSPGWNPGMIKPPGDPNFRPAPMWERPGPTPGSTIPWNATTTSTKPVLIAQATVPAQKPTFTAAPTTKPVSTPASTVKATPRPAAPTAKPTGSVAKPAVTAPVKTPSPAPAAKPVSAPPLPPPSRNEFLAQLQNSNNSSKLSNEQKVAAFEKYLTENKLTGKVTQDYLNNKASYGENDPRRFENPYKNSLYFFRAGPSKGKAAGGHAYMAYGGKEEISPDFWQKHDFRPTPEERYQGITEGDKAQQAGFYEADPEFISALSKKESDWNDAQKTSWRYGTPFSGGFV